MYSHLKLIIIGKSLYVSSLHIKITAIIDEHKDFFLIEICQYTGIYTSIQERFFIFCCHINAMFITRLTSGMWYRIGFKNANFFILKRHSSYHVLEDLNYVYNCVNEKKIIFCWTMRYKYTLKCWYILASGFLDGDVINRLADS